MELDEHYTDATEFLHEHMFLAGMVAGSSSDDQLPPDMLLRNVLPGPFTLVDESRLPDFAPVLMLLKITSKLSLVEFNKVPLNDILKKGLPLKGQEKEMEIMVKRECKNEVFFRTFLYMVLCFMLGTYEWLGENPYDFDVQTWIANYFCFSKRKTLVDIFVNYSYRDLMLYSCTAFLIESISLVPPFNEMVHSIYDWPEIVKRTKEAFTVMRQALIDAKHTEDLTGPSSTIFQIATNALPQHSRDITDPFKTKKNDLPSILPNIVKQADRIQLSGINCTRKGLFDMTGLSQINSKMFQRVFQLSMRHGVGVSKSTLDGLGFSPRGLRMVYKILESIDAGKSSTPKLYKALGPGDLSRLMAFVTVQKEMLQFDHRPLSNRVAEKQMEAIRRTYQLVEFEPLPKSATHLPFCPSCRKFKHWPVGSSHVGMESSGMNPFTGKLYCINKKKPECALLVDIPMVGYSLTVKKKTWVLCCYCHRLCSYGNPDMIDSYWWCGECERY